MSHLIYSYCQKENFYIPEEKSVLFLLDNKIDQINISNSLVCRLPENYNSSLDILKYLYENQNILSDIITVTSSETYFKKSNESINKLFDKGFKYISTKPVIIGEYNFKNHYSHFYSEIELEEIIKIIQQKFNKEYDNSIKYVLESKYYLSPDVFCMNHETFNKYCEFIFEILDNTVNIFSSKSDIRNRLNFISTHLDIYSTELMYDFNFLKEMTKIEEHIYIFLHNLFVHNNFVSSEIAVQDSIFPETLSKESKLEHNPLVSIIVPAYEQGLYIRDCLDSIVKQSFTDWECIIVDDGSSDKVRDIASYYENIDPRIRFFHTKNRGVGYARNFAVSKSSGKYIINLDADDILSKYYVELCVKGFDKYPDAILIRPQFIDFNNWKSNLKHIPNLKSDKISLLKDFDIRNMLFNNNYLLHSSCMFKREDFYLINGYDEEIEGYEDWEFYLRLLDKTQNFKIVTTDLPHHYHRTKANSRNVDAIKKHNDIVYAIIIKNKDLYSKYIDLDSVTKKYLEYKKTDNQ